MDVLINSNSALIKGVLRLMSVVTLSMKGPFNV